MDSLCPPLPATIARMNNKTCKTRKQKFMQVVQILAPGDQLIFQAAQRIPEEKLPAFPGGAALEFVVAFQNLRESVSIPIKPKARQARQDKLGPHRLECRVFSSDVLAPFQKGLRALSQSLRGETACRKAGFSAPDALFVGHPAIVGMIARDRPDCGGPAAARCYPVFIYFG